jgi:hypothetical protein
MEIVTVTSQQADAFARGAHLTQQTIAALVEFLKVEIDVGTTMVAAARQPCTSNEARARRLMHATAALNAVENYLWRVRAELSVFDELTFSAERLRFEIEAAKIAAEPNS